AGVSAAGEAAADALRDRAAGRRVHVEGGERQALDAAQLEAAPRHDRRTNGGEEGTALHTTMFNRSLSTTTTFFCCLHSRYFYALSLFSAAVSIAALSAAAATRICPRSLPLTCSISSISSCTSAASSTAGQASAAPGLSSAYRASQMCGTIGASSATA